jgi:mevalonate kinase
LKFNNYLFKDFQVRVPGKWVLSGEHSVLRGKPAIGLNLRFRHDESVLGLQVFPKDAENVVLQLIQKAFELAHIEKFEFPRGVLTLENSLPIGGGLGSSAALCVAITLWLKEGLQIPDVSLFTFATRLENQFHGQSSGMDVCVALLGEPILYFRETGGRKLEISKLPKFTFHDTGFRSRTDISIEKVEALFKNDLHFGQVQDLKMAEATETVLDGLVYYNQNDSQKGLELLASGMKSAQEVFLAWDLLPPEVLVLQESLYKKGALAVKVTGAGMGGFLVALWGND